MTTINTPNGIIFVPDEEANSFTGMEGSIQDPMDLRDAMLHINTLNQDFDDAFANYVRPENSAYPFVAQCLVVKDIPPRHPRFKFVLGLGSIFIDDLLNLRSDTLDGELTFCFPERWMSVQEAVTFTAALKRHPDLDLITRLRVATSSPLIVSSFMREEVRILSFCNSRDRALAVQLQPFERSEA